MPIFEESRYETADVVPLAARDGVFRATVVPTRVVELPTDYSLHRVVVGERFDTLAALAYEDSELWWVIADANPQVFYPDDLKPGTLIRIPSFAAVSG